MVPGSVSRSLFSWNAVLSRCVKSCREKDALKLYSQMQAQAVRPDKSIFVTVLKACASLGTLGEGKYVHAQIIESGCESDVSVGNSLVNMYAKCGSIADAESVFQRMPTRNVVSWSAMLGGYVNCELGQKALKLFQQMQAEDVKPDSVSFVLVLKACASMMTLEEGRYIHKQVIESGCESDVFVSSTLVDMYAKCGSIADAECVFQGMPKRNIVSWGAMLAGYVNCELGEKALELFRQMQAEKVKQNCATFVLVLKACASSMALKDGRHVHTQVIKSGCESDVFVGNSLVNMYAKCGSIVDAESVFKRMPSRNIVSWGAMLAGYTNCELGEKALELFLQMESEGVKQNCVTYVLLLKACASLMALEEGRHIHTHIIESGCELDVFVASALVDMYAKCGSIADAESIFQKMPTRNVVSWNAMLGGFAMHGLGKQALQLFHEYQSSDVKMDGVTFRCLLAACSHAGMVEEGIRLFESMGSVYGVLPTLDHYVCMVDLLGRAGRLDDAENFLRREPKIREDSIALRALLGACRNHGNVEMGKRVGQQILELDPDNAAGYVLLSNIYAVAGQRGSCEGSRIEEEQECEGTSGLYLD